MVHVLKVRVIGIGVQGTRRLRKSPGSQTGLSFEFDPDELMILPVLDSAARPQNPVTSIVLDPGVTSQDG